MTTLREYPALLGVRTPAWARRIGALLVILLLAPALLYLAGLMLVVAWPMLPLLGFLSGNAMATKGRAFGKPNPPSAAGLPSVETTLHSYNRAA